MAKPNPTFSPNTISNVYADVSKIVEDKHLDQKDISHEVFLDGMLLIGRRLERECIGYPVSKLNGLLSPIGKQLKGRFRANLGPAYLTRCIKLARTIPDHADYRLELTLKHYESLAHIKDETLRLELMNVAADNGWDTWRIDLHGKYQDMHSVPDAWGYHHFEPDQEVMRFARAYTDVCGIIPLEEFVELYNSCSPKPASKFEINETVWQIRSDSGKLDHPCITSQGNALYLVAPELYDDPEDAPYHYDDYGYSYRSYKRKSEYVEEMRALRRQRMNAQKATILSGHKNHPVKTLAYDDVLCGRAEHLRATSHLKQYVLRNQNIKANDLHAREDEFDFIFAKLLRAVGLNGMPSKQQIEEDAVFLMITVRPDLDTYEEMYKVAGLLSAVYRHAPIWEFNGHSCSECQDEKTPRNAGLRCRQTEESKQAA